MSCNCFKQIPTFEPYESFSQRLEISKCKCNARFVVSENKSRFEIEGCNVREVDKYKVDNFLLQDKSQKKCDYFFSYHDNTETTVCIFVELKGIDIETAVLQIDNTIAFFEMQRYFEKFNRKKIVCAIVSTGNPGNDATYRRLAKRLSTKYKMYTPIIERKKFEMRYNPKTNKFYGKGEK